MEKTVREIAHVIKGEVVGNADTRISGLSAIDSAVQGQMAFAFSKEHLQRLEETNASCVVVPKEFGFPSKKTLIKAQNPREAFINLLIMFHKPKRKTPGIHKQASISEKAKIGKGVYIGPCAVIEENVSIGDNSIIEAGVFIGKNTQVGQNTLLYPNATVCHNCTIGNNVIIHSGTVIGSDGFGFIEKSGIRHKIPQIGKVIIKDNVEIGSNTSIDRATVGETTIGEGTKIDNLVQIAHNVTIGKNVVIAGESGIAGSSVIEDNVTIAAQVGIKDHIRIGKGAILAAKCGVMNNVAPGKVVWGSPAKDARQFAKEVVVISKLTKNIQKILRLIKEK